MIFVLTLRSLFFFKETEREWIRWEKRLGGTGSRGNCNWDIFYEKRTSKGQACNKSEITHETGSKCFGPVTLRVKSMCVSIEDESFLLKLRKYFMHGQVHLYSQASEKADGALCVIEQTGLCSEC